MELQSENLHNEKSRRIFESDGHHYYLCLIKCLPHYQSPQHLQITTLLYYGTNIKSYIHKYRFVCKNSSLNHFIGIFKMQLEGTGGTALSKNIVLLIAYFSGNGNRPSLIYLCVIFHKIRKFNLSISELRNELIIFYEANVICFLCLNRTIISKIVIHK